MADFRLPGPQCSTRGLLADDGTLCLWFTPPPAPVCRADGAGSWLQPAVSRRWHNVSREGGWPAGTLTPSPPAVELLKAIETLRLMPYDDQTDEDITAWVKGATVGYGHLILSSEWATYKDGITKARAEELFLEDLKPAIDAVSSAITVGLQQYEFDALVILAFNIGINGFKSSSVVKLVNDPKASTSYASLEAAWKAWNKSQGKVMKGLDNRRAAEWKIYTRAVYERW